MDWSLYDNGLRHERVKHLGTFSKKFSFASLNLIRQTLYQFKR